MTVPIQVFLLVIICRAMPMCFNNQQLQKKEEKILLYSLTLEVDTIFLKLRKADQVIRNELNLLNTQDIKLSKVISLSPINWETLKKIIYEIPPQHLLIDEYILYLLDDETNSIFKLINQYNYYLEWRKKAQQNDDYIELRNVDDKLTYYIRRLGAMMYHLNIHLNLLNVLLKNADIIPEIPQIKTKSSQKKLHQKFIHEGKNCPDHVRFLEITIDEPFAIATWVLEDISGDAIFRREQDCWQLMKISTSRFALGDFNEADVSLDVAQRMLRLHHQKLGY